MSLVKIHILGADAVAKVEVAHCERFRTSSRSWAGEVRNVSLLVAIGVNGEGYR
jgi:hypothetical protein